MVGAIDAINASDAALAIAHLAIAKAGKAAQAEYAATHASPERLLQAFDEVDANRRKEELEIMRSRGEL